MAFFKWFGDKIRDFIEEGEEEALHEIGQEMVDYIKENFTDPGSYRMWRSKRPGGGWHWSADPGMFPAIDTERLKESIGYTVERREFSKRLTVKPTADVEYAEAVEFGNSKAAPRPYLRPTMAHFAPRVEGIVGKNIAQKIWRAL